MKPMENKEYVLQTVEVREALELLAEECSELSQAALKLIRSMYQGNPTDVTVKHAIDNLIEEVGDVEMCEEVIKHKLLLNIPDVNDNPKWERWANRLKNFS